MSRIGKKPIVVPAGASVSRSGATVRVKGKLGELAFDVTDDVTLGIEGNEITVQPANETKRARALWGTTRAIIANNVKGVTEGYTKTLELVGVGYRAAVEGTNLKLQLGLSHDVIITPPAGVKLASSKPTEIVITGIDKQVVGQVAAEIRGWKPPEPYKGKGIKYQGEFIRRKEGKKK